MKNYKMSILRKVDRIIQNQQKVPKKKLIALNQQAMENFHVVVVTQIYVVNKKEKKENQQTKRKSN